MRPLDMGADVTAEEAAATAEPTSSTAAAPQVLQLDSSSIGAAPQRLWFRSRIRVVGLLIFVLFAVCCFVELVRRTSPGYVVGFEPRCGPVSVTGADAQAPEELRAPNRTAVLLGNGCFWERQWAYYNIEKAWGRTALQTTSLVGYAGGTGADGARVCYKCGWGCSADYEALGHAEVVQVELDGGSEMAQMEDIAAAFFDSFTGPFGQRARPDPMDRGAPYRRHCIA